MTVPRVWIGGETEIAEAWTFLGSCTSVPQGAAAQRPGIVTAPTPEVSWQLLVTCPPHGFSLWQAAGAGVGSLPPHHACPLMGSVT